MDYAFNLYVSNFFQFKINMHGLRKYLIILFTSKINNSIIENAVKYKVGASYFFLVRLKKIKCTRIIKKILFGLDFL